MLCAQHALNNLIQASLFSASELANIAHELDQLEAAQLDQDQLQERNQNADETGFFSVAVLEQALAFVNLK
jgi:ataxin-3